MATTTALTVRCENCGKLNRVPTAGKGKPRCGNRKAYLPWTVSAGDEDFTEVAERFSVQAVPTLMVLHRGEAIARQSGAAPVDVLRRWVNEAVTRIPAARLPAKSGPGGVS